MKASELRIGNLVKQSGNIVTVESLERSNNDWDRTNGLRTLDCKPIPLTEEWLLKFGYSVTDENTAGKIYHIAEIGKFLNDDIMLVLYIKGDFKNCIFRKREQVKYVHQLQNLYFALTGEELTIEQ